MIPLPNNFKHIVVSISIATLLTFTQGAYAESKKSLNLKGVDIQTLIETVSRLTGKNFIVDPRVKGTVTVITGRDLNDDELYDTFLSVLQVHGFVVIEQGNISKILPKNLAVQETARIIDQDSQSKNEELVTKIVQVHHVNALSIATALRPLARGIQIQHHSQSNNIIMSGRSADLERLTEIIQRMDKADEKQIVVIPIQYADAKEVVKAILALNPPNAKGQPAAQATKVSADERTNSVLVTGDKATREIIRRIVSRLDVPKADKSKILVLPLRFASAEDVVKTIQELDKGTTITGQDGKQISVGGATKVSADKRTNSIIISGDAGARTRIAEMIQTLDIKKEINSQLAIINLKYADAAKIVQTVKELDSGQTITGADGKQVKIGSTTKVSANERTNSIVISGDKEARTRLTYMIRALDIKKADNSQMMVIELKYADATKMVQTVKELDSGNIVTGADGKQVQIGSATKVSADDRTNSVIISGDLESRSRIARMIQTLDIPKVNEGNTKVIYLRYAQAKDLANVLQGISKTELVANADGKAKAAAQGASTGNTDVDIQADESSNSLIITAEKDVLRNLENVIKRLDIRRAQVMVETIVAEVSSNLSNALGVQFGFNGSGSNGPALATNYSGAGGSNLNTIAAAVAAGSGALAPGLLVGMGIGSGGSQFVSLLNTLATDAATNILSTPTLVTMDNEEAEIIVGQNIPLVTGSYTSTGTGSTSSPFQTIERQDVGLTLKVKPQINEGTSVKLSIKQEVSSLAASVAGASDLITNKRSINTNVMVDDGQILVLGGLLENTFRDTEEKVPILGDLPVIGRIFRHDASTKDKQYLMVFIHPVIMRDNLTANAYTREKYSVMQDGQHQTDILSRGRFNQHPERFPTLDSAVTRNPQQRQANRQQREQQQRELQQLRQQEYKRREQLKRQQNMEARKRAQAIDQQRRKAVAEKRRKAAQHIPIVDDY